MAPFEKFVIARTGLSYRQTRAVMRHVRRWRLLSDEARENYKPRLRGWRTNLAFVLITTAIQNPVYMILGPILAVLLYLMTFAIMIHGFLKG